MTRRKLLKFVGGLSVTTVVGIPLLLRPRITDEQKIAYVTYLLNRAWDEHFRRIDEALETSWHALCTGRPYAP